MPLQDLIPKNAMGVAIPWLNQPGPDLPTQGPALNDLLPTTAAPSIPTFSGISTPNAGTTSLTDARINDAKQRLQDLYTPKAAPHGFVGHLENILKTAGNVAGNIIAPETMALTPGTSSNHFLRQQQAKDELDRALQVKSTEEAQDATTASTAQTKATTDYTEQRPDIERAKLTQKLDLADAKNQTTAALKGQKYSRDPETGEVTIEDDPTSEVFQRNQIKEQVLDAQVQSAKAQQGLRAAQTAWEQAKLDPNSPASKIAWGNLQARMIEARAASTRAQTGVNQYMMRAYNKGANGDILPGAPQLQSDDGTMLTPGTANASTAIKSNSNVGIFRDVYQGMDHATAAAEALAAKNNGRLDTPGVIAAMAAGHSEPKGFSSDFVHNYLASKNAAGLSPEERDYVAAQAMLPEKVQGTRKSAGGGATDTQVGALTHALPNAQTPDIDMYRRQIQEARSLADNLTPGVATARGGLTIRGKGASFGSGNTVTAPDGKTYTFKDAAAAAEFKREAGIK